MKTAEFDRCLAELEKLPPDRAEAAVDAFWNVILGPVPRDLAKAIVMLVQRPNLRIGELMRAGIGNGAAMKARAALATVRDRLPPVPAAPEPIELVAESAAAATALQGEILPPEPAGLPDSRIEIQEIEAALAEPAPLDSTPDPAPDSVPPSVATELAPQPPGPEEPSPGPSQAVPRARTCGGGIGIMRYQVKPPKTKPVSKLAKRPDPSLPDLPEIQAFADECTEPDPGATDQARIEVDVEVGHAPEPAEPEPAIPPDLGPSPASVEPVLKPPPSSVPAPANGRHGPPQAASEAAESMPELAPSSPEKPPVTKTAKRSDPLPVGNGFKQRATRLLRTELKDGPRPQAELVELAESDDITEEQLLRVAERLNIRTQKGWWRLPEDQAAG